MQNAGERFTLRREPRLRRKPMPPTAPSFGTRAHARAHSPRAHSPRTHSHGREGSSRAGMERAIEAIEASPHRLTKPRRLLLEAIFEKDGPFSAAELSQRAARRARRGGCDPVTVYRTLGLFEDLGIIQRCDFAADKAHYEVSRPEGSHHHHFLCRACGKVEPLDFCVVEGQEQLFYKLGYSQLEHRLEFTGLCPTCSPEPKARPPAEAP